MPLTPCPRATLAVVATAISVGVLPAAATAAKASGKASSQLQSKLLTLSQFPAGWSQSTPENGVGCLANLIQPAASPPAAITERFFTTAQGAPNVDERLATYSNPAAAYKAIIAHLDGCKRLKGQIDGTTINGQLEPIAFGQYGTATAAFNAAFKSDGVQYGDDIVIIRDRNLILGMDEGTIAPVSTSQFSQIVALATKRLG